MGRGRSVPGQLGPEGAGVFRADPGVDLPALRGSALSGAAGGTGRSGGEQPAR